ncbi:unnamed protein product, partial [Prorocentrum cordatum]
AISGSERALAAPPSSVTRKAAGGPTPAMTAPGPAGEVVAGARALRAELEALRGELALVREAHADARRLRTAGGAGVRLLAQGDEWAAIGHHSDEEEAENGCRSTRHAQQTFHARERRLTLGADALERHAMIGDVDVEVHAEGKEWQHGSDSGDDAAHDEQSKLRHAENTFRKRERRLTHGEQELLSGRPHGDKDVDLLPEKSEWAHHEGDSSDGEGAQAQFNEEVHRRRERRLTRGASIREMEVTMGDADVPVVAEGTEWVGAEGHSDDEVWVGAEGHSDDEVAHERFSEEVHRRRERRLTRGASIREMEVTMGDADVPVVAEGTEWVGAEGHSDDEVAHERFSEEVHRRRERRLTRGASIREMEVTMGDADVPVVAEGTEWVGAEGHSDEDEGALERFSEEVHRRRERRLTRGASIRDMEVTMGDIDVPVVAEKTEWAGCGDRGDSEEEGEDAQRRHADDTSRSRERRLTFGMEALKDEKPLGDLEVPILAHSAEWGALEGNHEEDEDDHERSHTERSMARERRLTEGEEALKRFASAGDADEKEPRQGRDRPDE